MINEKIKYYNINIFFNFLYFENVLAVIKIKYKIQDEIITTLDIEKEVSYLLALNNQLESIDKKKLIKLAENSIIKEKIKKITLRSIYKLDQKDPYIDSVIKSIYSRMNIINIEQFKTRLSEFGLDYQYVKKKIEIEIRWNDLIFSKYKDKLKINKKKLISKINEVSNQKIKEYQISEILFEIKPDSSIEKIYNQINESINEIGFSNTANLYSISDSSKTGGKIGWVKENNLSKILIDNLNKIKIGEFTDPVQVGNNFLILRIDDMRFLDVKIDKDKELKNMIEFEKNKQLSQFSQIFFNKVKSNIIIDG